MRYLPSSNAGPVPGQAFVRPLIRYPRDENGNLRLNMPGYGAEDLDIELKEDSLFVKTKDEKFSREFVLLNPDKINLKEITATCEKGVLIIELPEIKAKVTKIPIK